MCLPDCQGSLTAGTPLAYTPRLNTRPPQTAAIAQAMALRDGPFSQAWCERKRVKLSAGLKRSLPLQVPAQKRQRLACRDSASRAPERLESETFATAGRTKASQPSAERCNCEGGLSCSAQFLPKRKDGRGACCHMRWRNQHETAGGGDRWQV
jgi:hypothetical protein